MAVVALLFAWQAGAGAKAQAREAIRTNPLDPRIEVLLQSCITASPDDPEAHYLYGQWAILNHKEALAIQQEMRAAALSPGNHAAAMQAWTLVGVAEDTLDHEALARAAFEKAKAANFKMPRPDANALFEYAKFLQKRGKIQAANGMVAEVLRIDPALGPAHLLKARFLESAGDSAGAAAEGEAALLSARDDEELRTAHAYLAKTYFAAGNPEKAQIHREWVERHGSVK